MDKDKQEFDIIMSSINSIKEKLMENMSRLENAGYVRKAKSLGTIIGNLEHWQHTK